MTAVLVLSAFLYMGAAPASHYSASSRLADGKWVKISISKGGMQYISDASLRQMGFSDPSKVHVYGYGGRMLPEEIGPWNPDDLPMQLSERTAGGLVFFATDYFDIKKTDSRAFMTWAHVMNPYSEASYYFLSDTEKNIVKPEKTGTPEALLDPQTTFTAHLVHERDIFAPSTSGRILLGEDFRTQPLQSFTFDLPGNTGEEVRVKVGAASAVTNGASTFTFSVNGKALPAQSTDRITSLTLDSQFMRYGEIYRSVSGVGESMKLDIRHSLTGVSKMTRLDYVEVEYERSLALKDKELYFYVDMDGASTFRISGCDASTRIWDVSDSGNPAEVNFALSGGNAVFTVSGTGMRQFVAFNSGEFSSTPVKVCDVANQDLHALESPDFLIITPPEYRSQAETIADLHREVDGLSVVVLEPQTIYNEFSSGNPDVTAFRRLLKMWYDRSLENPEAGYARYCLMMSRPTYDNKMKTDIVRQSGYPRLPIWQSPSGNSGTTSFSTDDYIGMLEDAEAFDIASAKIHVGVGRLPIKNSSDADVLVEKLTSYMKSPEFGVWRNNVMLIADDQDNGIHLEQSEKVRSLMRENGNGDSFFYDLLYLDSYPLGFSATGASYPEAKKRMLDKWKEGVMMINYIGHASPNSWSHEGLLTWSDIQTMANTNLPFLYAATCEFGRHDDDNLSGAEVLVANPAGGLIATITPSRTVYISQNGTLSNSAAKVMFSRDNNGNSKRLGDILRESKNGYGPPDDNKLRYALIGDPALRLQSPSLEARVSAIAGIDITGPDCEFPVISARSQIEICGDIRDIDDNIVSDFEGTVTLSLYDAEKVVETYGNGDAGKVCMYNDRSTRLYIGRAKVENGKWSIRIFVPFEIENNYSPALLSLYAFDEKGREANGSSEKFYVYGYDSDSPEDSKGPEISSFFLNNESFTNGQLTHSSPLVLASFTDESGINLSDAGMGHRISLTLDERETFEDVVNYYQPDDESPNGGSFAYPLNDLKPGYHTLDLRVWDTANNSSVSRIEFQVGVNVEPSIFDVICTGASGGENAVFTITTDRPMSRLKGKIEVFDLSGALVWTTESEQGVGKDSSLRMSWNLRDEAGRRVPRGIYVYRASIETSEGTSACKSKKMAIGE